jgi:hypothetical protein
MPLKERLQSSSSFASRIRPIRDISHEFWSRLKVKRHNVACGSLQKSEVTVWSEIVFQECGK